ncbi:MAG: hypothetical protein FI737_01855 [SAR202 cluster bacterium]|nr:hypothetical protein [Dehalococcoidia bacterium]MQF87821.1 hypothetical protein [SAR202 cluster bacterium]
MINTRRIPVPLAFSLVLALVIALIIFFGAWAVSADVGNRTLAFGLPGTTPTLSGSNLQDQNSGPYQVARLGDHGTTSDTWWGGAFLRACPLH